MNITVGWSVGRSIKTLGKRGGIWIPIRRVGRIQIRIKNINALNNIKKKVYRMYN
jgi:hypothetical protein